MTTARFLAATYLFAVACSSEPADKAEPAAPPQTTKMMIVAADGGTLTLDDGATVVFGPGALAADAEVTFERTCPVVLQATGLGRCSYRVETDADLARRVEVTIPTYGEAPSCVLAETEDGWRCLADSQSVGPETVGGTVSQLAALTARTGEEPQNDDTCTDPDFTNCGGDLLGSWSLVRVCGTREQATGQHSEGPDPYASCGADAVFRSYPFTVSGTVTFTDDLAEIGGTDLAYSTSGSGEMFEREIVTQECLASVGESCPSSCSSDRGVCDCFRQESTWNSAGGSYYEVVEGELFLDGFDTPTPYCVSGDELIIHHDHPAGAYFRIYQRRS